MNSLFPMELTPALDGARVLWRHWRSAEDQEGFIREFSADKSRVRISKTARLSDAGTWHRSMEIRVDAVLDPTKAPKQPKADEVSPPSEPEDES